ncbi:MAG: discoidin domain-containing protein [Clostridia bacterium]|nr:discoidin domain-containing protein [Clostridia bacterium]
MLTCKKCGAIMSGTDLVCKKCGTPWGKSGRSKTPILVSLLLIILISLGFLYITNKELFLSIVPVDFYANLMDNSKTAVPEKKESSNSTENTIKEETKVEPAPVEENTVIEQPITDINDIDSSITLEDIKNVPQEQTSTTLPPVFTSVRASSNLPAQGNFKYTPQMLLDDNKNTAWTEGVKGNGIDEWVQFIADNDQTVSGLIIYNGYQKNATTYANNGRLKKVAISFADGTVENFDIPAQKYTESLNGYNIKFDTPKTTNYVTVKILDVYKGAYYTDTAVNKIEIY